MKAHFNVTDPDSTEMSLQIIMPLREWKKLRAQLTTDYPSWRLSNLITMMVNHAYTHFSKEVVTDGSSDRVPE